MQIDKISSNFIRNGLIQKRKLHLLNWDIININKLSVGLGIPRAETRNYALLTSLEWRCFHSHNTSLWARLLKCKYLIYITPTHLKFKQNSSFIWKGLTIGYKIMIENIKYIVVNGQSTNVYYHHWLPLGTLRSEIYGPLTQQEEQFTIS